MYRKEWQDNVETYVERGWTPEQEAAIKAGYEARKDAATERVNTLVMEHIDALTVILEFEEGEEAGTLADLQIAINSASAEEIERFLDTLSMPFDGGYISVKF